MFNKKKKINPRKIMGKSKLTPLIRVVSILTPGRGIKKVEAIAKKVINQIKYDNNLNEKCNKKILTKDAHAFLKKPGKVGFLHCADRSNLAISMLRGTGIKSWLAREIRLNTQSGKIEFHDYVEFFLQGKIHTLAFGEKIAEGPYYLISEGSAHKNYASRLSQIFRGADAGHIGGMVNYEKYSKFVMRVEKDPQKQLDKEKRRLELLVKSRIMPKQALEQLKKS
jgi:hypothetical protein